MLTIHKALILPYNQNFQVLLQDRSNIAKIPYIPWGYFGGGVEPGETPLQAVIRETKEELDIEVPEQELHLIGTFDAQYRENEISSAHVFLWKFNRNLEDLHLHEGKDMRWVTFDEALEMLILDGDKKIIQTAKAALSE
jgi:mutator protein MutT